MGTIYKQEDDYTTSSAKLLGIAPENVGEAWQYAAPLVRKGIAKALQGRMTAADLRQKAERGEYKMWLVVVDGRVRAVGFTNIVDYPQKRICNVMFIAGEHRAQWLHLMGYLEDWAKGQGCHAGIS